MQTRGQAYIIIVTFTLAVTSAYCLYN